MRRSIIFFEWTALKYMQNKFLNKIDKTTSLAWRPSNIQGLFLVCIILLYKFLALSLTIDILKIYDGIRKKYSLFGLPKTPIFILKGTFLKLIVFNFL